MIALKDPLLRNATRAVMSVTSYVPSLPPHIESRTLTSDRESGCSHESALKTLTPELPVSEEDKLHSNNKEELEEDKVLVTDVDNPVTSRGNALNLSVEEEDVSSLFPLYSKRVVFETRLIFVDLN